MPYWLKGGIIGGGLTLLSIGLAYACPFLTPDNDWGCALSFYIPMIPFIPLFDNVEIIREIANSFFQNSPFILIHIVSIAVWFIVGSLIGTLVHFTRQKKSK